MLSQAHRKTKGGSGFLLDDGVFRWSSALFLLPIELFFNILVDRSTLGDLFREGGFASPRQGIHSGFGRDKSPSIGFLRTLTLGVDIVRRHRLVIDGSRERFLVATSNANPSIGIAVGAPKTKGLAALELFSQNGNLLPSFGSGAAFMALETARSPLFLFRRGTSSGGHGVAFLFLLCCYRMEWLLVIV
jgi:hypothetical protein